MLQKNDFIGTFNGIHTIAANVISYGGYQAFVPLFDATYKTITITSMSYMSANTTVDVTGTATVVAKRANGFTISNTNAAVAGCTCIVSFTVV